MPAALRPKALDTADLKRCATRTEPAIGVGRHPAEHREMPGHGIGMAE
jgi:hypothetical protein